MKQIFLLSDGEMDNLKHGIPLEIALSGGAMIQLQAENPRRKYDTSTARNLTDDIASDIGPVETLSDRIKQYLLKHGKSRSIDIIRGLGDVSKSSVTSSLSANRKGYFKSTGTHKNRWWRVAERRKA